MALRVLAQPVSRGRQQKTSFAMAWKMHWGSVGLCRAEKVLAAAFMSTSDRWAYEVIATAGHVISLAQMWGVHCEGQGFVSRSSQSALNLV